MKQEEKIQYALSYCFKNKLGTKFDCNDGIEFYKLNRQLNYMLCRMYDRFSQEFMEVTRKDVIILIEAWIMAQGTCAGHPEPICHKTLDIN